MTDAVEKKPEGETPETSTDLAVTTPGKTDLSATPPKGKMGRRAPLADTNTNPVLFDGARRPYQIASVESISGTVAVANFPTTQPVSGSVAIVGGPVPVVLSGPPTDRTATGTLAALNDTVAISTQGGGNVGVQLSGTSSALIAFEATVDGTNWILTSLVQLGGGGGTGSAASVSSLAGSPSMLVTLRGMVGGFAQFRVRFSGYSSGSVAVALEVSETASSVRVEQATPSSLANAWPVQMTDGTRTATFKAASTAAVATDPALVVAISPNNPVATAPATSSTPAQSSVAGNAASVQLLAANTARKGATVFNDSAAILYLKLGVTASLTSYTVQMNPNAYYELPYAFTGEVDGIWGSATGNARITELT